MKMKILGICILVMFGFFGEILAQSDNDLSNYGGIITRFGQNMIDNANAAIQKDDGTNDNGLSNTDFGAVKSKGVDMGNKLKLFGQNMKNLTFDQKSFYKIINDTRNVQKFIISKFYESYMNSKGSTKIYIALNLIDMNLYGENANRRENMTSDNLGSIFDDYTNKQYKYLKENTNKQKVKYPSHESLYEKSYNIYKKYIDYIVDLQKQSRNGIDVRPQMDSLIKNMVKDGEKHKEIWKYPGSIYTSYQYIITKLLYYRNKY